MDWSNENWDKTFIRKWDIKVNNFSTNSLNPNCKINF